MEKSTRALLASRLAGAIRRGDEDEQVRLVFEVEATYPDEMPEMSGDDETDLEALRLWVRGRNQP